MQFQEVHQKPVVEGHGFHAPSEDEIGSKHLLSDIKSDPKWSSHLDDDTGKIYFFNRLTKERCSSKPADYDGHYIIGETKNKQSEYENTFGDFGKKFCTPMDIPKAKYNVIEIAT